MMQPMTVSVLEMGLQVNSIQHGAGVIHDAAFKTNVVKTYTKVYVIRFSIKKLNQ